MTDQPIKLGVVGCGFTGREAVLATTVMPRMTAVAIAELDEPLRQRVAGEFSLPHAYADYRELLQNPDIDAVYLGTPPDVRLPMVLDTLKAGKHVLVQKPHAVRASEILQMDAAATETGKTLQFCYFMRHYPHNRKIRSAVLRGKIGEVYHGRIFRKYKGVPPLNDLTRWLHIYGYKGGVLGQHVSHELDLMWWWMGCPKPEWTFAAKHSVYPAYDGPEGPAEDYFTGLIGFERNKTIQIDCGMLIHSEANKAITELYGTTGSITDGALFRLRDSESIREEIDEPLEIQHSDVPENPPVFFYEINHFAMAVAGEVAPDVSAADAYTFMRILDALYDSAKVQQKVLIE